MEGCIAAMEEALAALARGEVTFPLRPVVRAPGENHLLGMMPAYRGGDRPLYSLKTVAVMPDNPARGLDAHQGTVTLFDGLTGRTLAVMNASPVTAIRTAAVTAVATRRLARPDAKELAIVGAGVQARSHLRALPGFERVRIASRTRGHAEALAAEFGAEVCDSTEEAVRGADVVVAATSSASRPAPRVAEGGRARERGRNGARARRRDAAGGDARRRPARLRRGRGEGRSGVDRGRARRARDGNGAGADVAAGADGLPVARHRRRGPVRGGVPRPARAGDGTGTTVEF